MGQEILEQTPAGTGTSPVSPSGPQMTRLLVLCQKPRCWIASGWVDAGSDRRLFLLDAFINYYLYCCHFFSWEFLQPHLWVRAAVSGQGDCNLPRRLEAGWQAGQRWPGQFVLLKAWLLIPTALSKILVWIQCLSALSAAREKSAAAAEPGERPRGGIANVTELPPRG